LGLELIPGAICGTMGFKLQDLSFSCKVLKKKSPTKNSKRTVQEWLKIA
jgi:hypothetical protein